MRRDEGFLTVLLAGAGVLHFVKPEPFERIVPRQLPGKRELVHASGVVEVASAVLLARPRTRQWGGRLATMLLIGVFPANVQMTVDVLRSRRAPTWFKVGVVARLPLQLPLLRIATRAARTPR